MDQIKERIGQAAASIVEDGMVVGLGTGSTAGFFIQALAKRVELEGLTIVTVASSHASEKLARELGLSFVSMDAIGMIDITFDGADEIDPKKQMIKGAGGALLKEKILAYNSRELVIMVDSSKCVDTLGKAKLPVEVVQFGHNLTAQHLLKLAASCELRFRGDGNPFITENQHFIYDLVLKGPVDSPAELDGELRKIAGVAATGFFYNIAGRVLIGYSDGTVKMVA